MSIGWDGKDPNEHDRFIHESIGQGYLETMKIGLVAGRQLDPALYHTTDSSGLMVNQTAVALMGYKDPIGKPVYDGSRKLNIVGRSERFSFFRACMKRSYPSHWNRAGIAGSGAS